MYHAMCSAAFGPSISYLSGVEKTENVAENNPDVIIIDQHGICKNPGNSKNNGNR